MPETSTTNPMINEINREIAENKICIFSKGTNEVPRCGFTIETKEFFEKYPYPFKMIDVLDNPEKREALSQMTDWRTLPKIFINGKFYGDTDILSEMETSGELQTVLKETFGQ